MDDWVKLLPLVGVLATVGIAIASWWRRQLIGKRRFEVAEEALIAFALAKDALQYIRNPGAFGDEGATRKPEEGESVDQKRMKDTYFVPFERINKTSEKFAPLRKTQLLCKYHFGAEAYDAFEKIFQARSRVSISARMLLETVGRHERNWTEESQRQRRKWENDIWGANDEEDEIGKKIDEAERALEKVCIRYLR